MSYPGQNPTSNTPQIWDGSKWVPYNALSLQSNVVTVSNSLWRNTDNTFGHSIGTNRKEGLSHTYAGASVDPVFATQRLFANLLGAGGGGDPQTLTLPSTVLGIATSPDGSAAPNVLVAEFLIASSHSSGSLTYVNRYIVNWVPGTSRNLVMLGDDYDPGFVVTASSSASPPTITVNYTGLTSGDTIQYFFDVELKVMGFRP